MGKITSGRSLFMKKIFGFLVILATIIIPSYSVSAGGVHKTPGGVDCDNGYRHYICRDQVYHSYETHNTGSYVCTITHFIISHEKECTSCHSVLGYMNIQCTDYHTVCNPHYPAKTCTTNFYE